MVWDRYEAASLCMEDPSRLETETFEDKGLNDSDQEDQPLATTFHVTASTCKSTPTFVGLPTQESIEMLCWAGTGGSLNGTMCSSQASAAANPIRMARRYSSGAAQPCLLHHLRLAESGHR